MNGLQQAQIRPLQGFRFLSRDNSDTQRLGDKISRTVYPSLIDPDNFSNLSVHVHHTRPDEDVDLWVQPYLSYTNEPEPKPHDVENAMEAANAALAKAILPLPFITHQEFLDAKAKEHE